MPRKWKIAIGILAVAVVIGLISLRSLHRRMVRVAETQAAEEQARHEVLAVPISTPTDVIAKAKIFWAAGPDQVAPVEIELPLSADPVQRSRQLLHALIASPPTPGQRTLPADTELLAFYILPEWHGGRGFLRCALVRDAVRNLERTDGCGFDRAHACEQRAGAPPIEDTDPWPGSGDARGQRGSHRILRFGSGGAASERRSALESGIC